MKKKTLVTMMTMALAAMTVVGCGKKEEVAETAPIQNAGVEITSTTTATEVEDIASTIDDEGYHEAEYFTRMATQEYLPSLLILGEKSLRMGDTATESKYFEYLADKWLDESWLNAELEGSVFNYDIFTAINNGLIDRMGATIADYTELETEMGKVYRGMSPVENEINQSYINVAVCDLAGFNGVNFNVETSITDVVTRDVVYDGAAIFARDDSFRSGAYLGADYTGDYTYYKEKASGADINYAYAVALGLDTTDPATSLIEVGYTAFKPESETIALIDYDAFVITNLQIYASKMPTSVDQASAGAQGSGDTSNSDAATGTGTGTGDTSGDQTKPSDNDTAPSENYRYNHPEAAGMSSSDIFNLNTDDGSRPLMTVDLTWYEDYQTKLREEGN